MRGLFLTLLMTVFFSASAQVDAFQNDIIDLLNINGTRQFYENSQEQSLEFLKDQIVKKKISKSEWKEIKLKNKEENLDNLMKSLSFAYRNHFSKEEIHELTTFYKTEAAKKLLSGKSKFSKEEDKIIDDFNNSDVSKRRNMIDNVLVKEMVTIYSDWKRELIASKMSELVKGGYTTPE
ncbi:MAG: DUF2059 domain-containing protein [Flavobacteriaceae bacterium]